MFDIQKCLKKILIFVQPFKDSLNMPALIRQALIMAPSLSASKDYFC